MPNICGKIVDSLRIQHGKICQQVSTVTQKQSLTNLLACVNTLLFRIIIPISPPVVSTPILSQTPLMNNFFTHFPHPLLLTPPKKI